MEKEEKAERSRVELQQPILAHGETINALELRKPTVKDIRNIGFPFTLDENGALQFNAKPLARYVEVLASIPPSSVDSMSPADFQSCVAEILSFFGDAKTKSQ
jgi:Phage tail protein E.